MCSKLMIISSVLLLALLLFACGDEQKAESGAWGSDRTNIRVYADVAPESYNVDICNSEDNYALAFINTSVINEDLPDNVLYLEKYSFEFQPVEASSPPIASGNLNNKKQLPVNGMNVIMVDSGRKKKYLADLNSGAYSAKDSQAYSVIYTFGGVDEYGSEFGVMASTEFSMGKYSACELAVSPSEISLVGVVNPISVPDASESDDVTFHIWGGIGPYTVYSDNTSKIPDPGKLGDGVSEFTVDPDSVSSSLIVKLTVVDSIGASTIASVTINP